ncbi:ferrous iron transport protein B [Persicobacter psychrovividus]|uniref:Ferrous iron transport protein B n=1 Tax=Persicobacter psychrovividus TaxID=387638 RepID=A0ABN6L4A7_9BACT|nr:ferrous iron transport protein B [Persicobacter psychrovividus]
MPDNTLKVALIGNPNAGKTSLFNHLTGLNQKVGNFPGVTVDKKTGLCTKIKSRKVQIIDFPGTYSIYPRSLDEQVFFTEVSNTESESYPDVAIVVIDAAHLKRNLLLFTQIKDIGLPIVIGMTMLDVLKDKQENIDLDELSKSLGAPIFPINGRNGEGVNALTDFISTYEYAEPEPFLPMEEYIHDELFHRLEAAFPDQRPYRIYQMMQQTDTYTGIGPEDREIVEEIKQNSHFNGPKLQAKETIARYKLLDAILKKVEKGGRKFTEDKSFSSTLDKFLVHPIFGYAFFVAILFFMFQAIYSWASIPMDYIDAMFGALGEWAHHTIPAGPLNSLISDGIIPGIGGIVIFVPQIAILFAFIAMLEETGYMARVVFLTDRIMRVFGLNGKSIVPLISGVACAIPAIMAARNIENWKERLITILISPLMSCSARLPVYAILIALVIPDREILGFMNLQGLVLMALYMGGFILALIVALIMNQLIKSPQRPFLIMELPSFRMPRWKNVSLTIFEKSKTFIFSAGKIIFVISIVLWALASYGPSNEMDQAEALVSQNHPGLNQDQHENMVASYRLEHSYAGHLGKVIEPVIAPLGYDWKIGIALITSFAAREVFVGSISTIYSVGSNDSGDNPQSIKDRLASEINPKTGLPVFTLASGLSLLIYYAIAMQCMSTLAIVKRETNSWKWPMIQLCYLTGMAYVFSLIVYQVLS